jgi:ABC-type Fe3+/spermidine/putrescine transport system ATPase subunit
LLLDEPFSNLDMIHKDILKRVIGDIGDKLAITCILVSHDPLDLMAWADEIVVLRNADIVQQGSPEQVYRSPVDEHVAGLFGKYNLIGKTFVRPEDIRIVEGGGGMAAGGSVAARRSALSGKVESVVFQGSYYDVEVQLKNSRLIVRTVRNDLSIGDPVFLAMA